MQKLDFVNNLETIVKKLQSQEISDTFQVGFNQPNTKYQFSNIIPLLFLSKSNYDQINLDLKYSEILENLNAKEIYNENNLSLLTTTLRTIEAYVLLSNSKIISLFLFHKTLISTLKLAKETLLNDNISKNFEDSIQEGINIFQVIIESEGLETEKYIKIFTAFQELIDTINKVLNDTEQKSEVILLDSGSDTNIGIKTGIETAKSLFLIFKEIWDFITNRKYYKQTQNNKALLESLSIRTEIQRKVDEGILSPEEGREYIHIIKTRTDDLIEMKVLPKQIAEDTNQVENKKLLAEFEGVRLLSQ